jgi:hypothetical protein
MAVEKVIHSCFHGPVEVSIYHISHSNYGVCMKRFVIDFLYIFQVTSRSCFVNHFKLYLPTGWEVSKYPSFFPFAVKSMIYGMKLFTVEHKKMGIRQNYLYA